MNSQREKSAESKSFYFYFPKGEKGLGTEKCTSPKGSGLWAFIGWREVVEQGATVGLQLVLMLSLDAGS